jgi:hypothetical protein
MKPWLNVSKAAEYAGLSRGHDLPSGLRFHDLRHSVITELAEMGVADHVLESISGHLSRRMREHYSHIRIDAKRQALDALDTLPRGGDAANGNGKPAGEAEMEANRRARRRPHVTVTSQFAFAGLAAFR